MDFIIIALVAAGLIAPLFVLKSGRSIEYIEIKDTMLGHDELQRHAIDIARSHSAGKRKRRYRWLLPRLNDNYKSIAQVYNTLSKDADNMFPTAPVAEWLLDNFYIIEEQKNDLARSLASGSPSGLPILKNSIYKGYPRIYAIALEIVSHTDGAVDENVLKQFITAYQSHSLLSMSELWALIIMIRVALFENIRQVCEKVMESQINWHRADETAKFILNNLDAGEDQLETLLKDKLGDELEFSFVEHLLHRLRKKGANISKLVNYLDSRLAIENLSTERVKEIEHQLQATRQVSIGNSITSLRFLSSMSWSEIFEELSQVEQILKVDPSGIYPVMDFETRNYYRNAIQKLAVNYNTTEIQVARKALECAKEAEVDPKSPQKHVGYYIVDKGICNLEEKAGFTAKGSFAFGRDLKKSLVVLYIGTILFITLLILLWFVNYGLESVPELSLITVFLIAVAVLIPASDLAISLINSILSHILKPSLLPKLELKDGIPDDAVTMVIVPTLLPNEKRAKDLISQIETLYHANKDKNLYFALVGDFKDSDNEKLPEDDKITVAALKEIERLNKTYSEADNDRFYLYIRTRKYNERQKRWMGWERKRGAISEFNSILRGKKDTTFEISSGDATQLPQIKYVITLDADTILPIGAAKKLVGTLMHPLNKAVVDTKRGIVTSGYGLLQPRINVSIISANNTLFSRIFAGQGGIDPYTTAVSDIYQDLFGEGIFTGKGIYELDVFEEVLGNAIPENTVLSHDLLEGSYVRVGLTTDIEMVDGYPSRYNSASMRLHRWTRGDWQLLPWLGRTVINGEGNKVSNPLSAISKWKIIDNLRRSLIFPIILLLLLLGVSIFPGNSMVWLGLTLITAGLPVITHLLNTLLSGNYRIYREKSYSTVIGGVKGALCQSVLLIAFIPYQAYMMADAIFRTLARVLFTKKNMLEWVTAADMEASLKNDLKSFWRKMWISPLFGILAVILSIFYKQEGLPVVLILLVMWTFAPYIAFSISKPIEKIKESVSKDDLQRLRLLARKTWAFYEDFATFEDNYLPPDNFQEEPTKVVAHRTSPTNIGFFLLACVAARDLGYIGSTEMLRLIGSTVGTLEKMEKWNGHLYNWYDTRNLRALRPRYVSTVDSGNFIAYLMVLEQSLKEYSNKPTVDINILLGIKDVILLFNEEANNVIKIETEDLDSLIEKGKIESQELISIIDSKLQKTENPELKKDIEKSFWGKKLTSYLKSLKDEVMQSGQRVEENSELYNNLILRIQKLSESMKFKPLYDEKQQLFSIGYNVEDGHLTRSYYDLLASEARQASYIAVARGEVSPKHWCRLGRKLVMVDRYKGLVSWTGTMFEYLMPLLIMKDYENTIFSETYKFVVENQIKYGQNRGIPWGVSESGYSAFDISLNYQYRAFGIPELGLKRGLENDVVIAPYATVLALPVAPNKAVKNIRQLEDEGMEGVYGLYEAIDYTPARLKRNEEFSIIRSFMAHHQGMSFIALDNYFNNNIMQTRFHMNPVIRSAELLLQEKIPSRITFTKEHKLAALLKADREWEEENVVRLYREPNATIPNVHVISNGSYSVMVTDGGLGYSKNHDMAVTRWNRDIRGKKSGMFVFVQNLNSNDVWSTTYEPFLAKPDFYRVIFSPDKADFVRKDGSLETRMQITVSPEDNAEIRKVSITNLSLYTREIEVTSYFEVVLTNPDADVAHPTFSNLFIRTEFIKELDSIIASRRPRMHGQDVVWAVHTMALEGETTSEIQYETDRSKFIGRDRDVTNPVALDVGQPLSNSDGAVLDPVMSLRRRFILEPGKTARICYTVATAESRNRALEIADKYHEMKASTRAFELAWTRSQIEARYLGLKTSDIESYLNIIPYILFYSNYRLQQAEYIIANRKGQSGLWPYGISGDLPIILVSIDNKDDLDRIVWILKAHEFWKLKGINIDLVIMLEQESSYTQPLHDAVMDAISSSHARELVNQKGGVFLRNARHMPPEDISMFYTAAQITITAGGKPIPEQLSQISIGVGGGDSSLPKKLSVHKSGDKLPAMMLTEQADKTDPTAKLDFFNGLGGFTGDGKEYVITLKDGQTTPVPWINVVSNKKFGFQVSEVGSGCTWSENGRENKITPWSNDPVTDPAGEAFYLRDEVTGDFWSLAPMPVRGSGVYTIRHGFGYSVFEHAERGIDHSLTMFAAADDPVKLCLVVLANKSGESRQLTLTNYIRPVLGVHELQTSGYIVTGQLEGTNALTAQNVYSTDFSGRIAFAATSEAKYSFTGDRLEFLGARGSVTAPEAMKREGLSGRLGAGYDPCIAMQVPISLLPGEVKEIVFILGQGKDIVEVTDIVNRYNNSDSVKKELDNVKKFWKDTLETVQVNTPDTSMNILINGWLLYQVISCRLWARSAFYQSGGAFGFRDQLQDVMAVVYTWPEKEQKQILLHCAHQFIEGDVQHWWHAEAGKGIRTKYSDDLLWLPYVTADYIENTGDFEILDEVVGYLKSPILGNQEDERYEVPSKSEEEGTVYEHCIRALEKGLSFGEHGIPLMGCGDWNDGMNTVGNKGRGESIWLGWFIYTILKNFIPICRKKNDLVRIKKYEEALIKIEEAMEKYAWDGGWYIRAYFDDGTPLGSARNSECKIDSISQSWSVISGAGRTARVEEAMNAVEKHLIDNDEGIIKLLTPPFDNGDLHPGYIKGYVPGVRENGGQYTHAATWVILAFAKMGRGDKAWELFNMINPINHSRTPIEYNRFKVEPYVMTADVYSISPHTGRGGWSWYTGAAGWMYRVGVEHMLGFKKQGNYLVIDPCIPKNWGSYSITYNNKGTVYDIEIKNLDGKNQGLKAVLIDGQETADKKILLANDGKPHKVEVLMG